MRRVLQAVGYTLCFGWIVPLGTAACFAFVSVTFSQKDDFDNWNAVACDLGAIAFARLGVIWLTLAIIPCLFVLWRRRSQKAGCCPHCGYDLTGNVSGVCPECGRSVEQKAARAAGD